MTALAACLSWSANAHARSITDRILTAQKQFGPHHTTLWGDGSFACGRNLMRTVPDDLMDRQPFIIGGGRAMMAADLRLDNRDDLLDALDIPASKARMLADGGVLAAALDRWGLEDTLPRLVGVFALIIQDRQDGSITLVRDPIGLSPLFYSRQSRFLAVSSMIQGLFALPEVERDFDEKRLAEHLALLPQDSPSTLYAQVNRVMPGHWTRLSADGQEQIHPWSDLTAIPEASSLSFEDALEAMDEAMTRATYAMTRSTGGVGSQLSAGLSSGVITALAARTLTKADKPLHTFTAAPRDTTAIPPALRPTSDEWPQAVKVAAHFPNIIHHRVFNDASSMLETNARYVRVMNETPPNLPNGVWMDAINQDARSAGVTTMLSGQFGTITFSAGLPSLSTEFMARGLGLPLAKGSWQLWRKGAITGRTAIAHTLRALLTSTQYAALQRRFARPMRTKSSTNEDMLHDSIRTRHDLDTRIRNQLIGGMTDPDLSRNFRVNRMTQVDIGTLRKAMLGLDQIDVRDPSCDLRVVRLCLSLPLPFFIRGRDRAFAQALYERHISTAGLATFFCGHQAADQNILFQRDRNQIIELLGSVTQGSPHLKPIAMDTILNDLVTPSDSPLLDTEQTLVLNTKYSRLIGLSQVIRAKMASL
ncbi:asparagine synthetase B family protein [Rhodospirillum sp. A1_3_36]|uniref:asparagine synthetase B family protein n=1 Tax=Rhodospirillum sp. A1_3_36 TaxID=3391666 RepID=UPI0039A493B2